MDKLDEQQEFVLQKIRRGLKSEEVGRPMTETDRERLSSGSSIRKDISSDEWDEWSQRIHHALQVAFLKETDDASDSVALNRWREQMVEVVDEAFQRVTSEDGEPLVLEDAATHFVQNDLYRYLKMSEGQIELSQKEKRLVEALNIPVSEGGGGCLGSAALALLVGLLGALFS